MEIMARCEKCGREWLTYRDFRTPCPYPPSATYRSSGYDPAPCGGRVTPIAKAREAGCVNADPLPPTGKA